MGFYQELSRHYDEIFDVSPAEMAFVDSLLAGKRRILDIGCGTGNKTVHLAQGDRDVVAFDLDPGMIGVAKKKHAKPNIHYMTLDMLRIRDQFPVQSFDAALCLGNTLVHLASAAALRDFLAQAVRVLAADGVFVVQILNYDRILARGIFDLPVIDKPRVRFVRHYEWRDGELHFQSELTVRGGGTLRSSVVLRPLGKDELGQALATAGFSRVEYFGSYAGAPYDPDSYHLIAVARRNQQ